MDEFARSAVNFSKRIVKLEVQCKQLKDENNDLEEEAMDAKGKMEEMKGKYAKLKDKCSKRKEKFDSEERKWREEEEKLTEIRCQLERENKKLENNLRASAAEALRCVAKKLREVEAEAEAMKSLMEEKDAKITSLVKKNESLERFRSRSEIDSKAKEEKIVVLTQKIQVLEAEKGKLDAEFYKVKEDNEIKGRRICDLIKGEKMLTEYDAKITSLVKKNESLERFRSRLEIDSEVKEEKIVVLTQKIQVLEGEKGKLDAEFYKVKEDNEIKGRRICDLIREKEGEKMLIEYEGKKRVSALNHRIEVLEREKKEVEDNFSLFVEKSEEINMIVNERPVIEAGKTTLEAETKKNVLELIQRIEVLEREKAEWEAEVNQGKVGKKSEEITSNLKKKHKEISNLVFRSDVLGSRKHRFDSQTRERDERIKVLMQEKERLVGTKKKMEIETNICVVKSKEDVELPQSMHLDASNVDIISTTTQNEGPEYTDVAAIEPQESSDGGLQSRGLLGSEIPKIVFEEGIGCSLAIQAGTKCCKLDGLTEHNTLQHRLEVQTKEKDERIKMLVQEKECLVGKKKKIENEINRCNVNSKEDVELPQPVQAYASNIDGTSSPTQNGGPEYIDVSDTEPELLAAKITKRKVEVLGCSAAIQAAIKCCKLDGLTESKALQQRLEAQKEQEERIKMLVHENDSLVGEENKMENETNRCAVNSKEDVELPQRVHPDASNVDSTSTPTTQNGVSSPCPSTSTSSRYENQKWRDWNSFHKYLKNQKPDLTLSCCSGNHVREYLLYLDQFGKTIIHSPECPFYGHPSPSDPCPCPIRQGWGSLDALIGRLRAAFEEHGGKPENNPFGTEIVRRYLLHIKDSQSKARGVSYQKSRKNPRKAADSFMRPAPTPRKAVDSFMLPAAPAPPPRRRTLPRRRAHSYMPPLPPPGPC